MGYVSSEFRLVLKKTDPFETILGRNFTHEKLKVR